MRNAYRNLGSKYEWERECLSDQGTDERIILKCFFKDTGYEDVNWIHMAWD
jgi:hypothetical protein